MDDDEGNRAEIVDSLREKEVKTCGCDQADRDASE